MTTAAVAVLCDEAVGTGFRLAGVAADEVTGAVEAATRLEELLARENVGVILVQDDLWDAFAVDLRRRAERVERPVVVPFPAPGRPAGVPAAEHIVEILRRAIGYRVHL